MSTTRVAPKPECTTQTWSIQAKKDADARRRTARRLKRLSNIAFASLLDPCQQERAGDYVLGLVAQPLHKDLTGIALAADCNYQSLQHFMTDSPWESEAVQVAAALELQRVVGRGLAWMTDDTGQKKQGKRSVAVQRQYSGTFGKVDNCQIDVSLDLVGERGSGALDRRLFMPGSWDADTEENKARRKAARVPDDIKHQEKWRLVLEMTQKALDSGLKPQPVLGDQAYGVVYAFRAGLEAQGLQYMLEVPSDLVAHPVSVRPRKLTGKRASASKPLIREKARSLASLAEGQTFRLVQGLPGKYLAIRIRPAGEGIKPGPDGQYEACWLVLWLMLDGTIKYLLSNLPDNAHLRKLARLASLRWRIEQDYREDKQCLGLAHLQTRTYGAWYKHAALLAVARLLVLSQMLTAAEGSFYKALTSLRKLVIGLIGYCTTCGWTAHPPSDPAPV